MRSMEDADFSEDTFASDPEFCATCGSILPLPDGTTLDNYCPVCHLHVSRKALAEISYVVHFNDPDVYSKERELLSGPGSGKNKDKTRKEVSEGPLVDRECRECGHNQMSYATLQLRSADEGQTVFYTCPKCKFKESENS